MDILGASHALDQALTLFRQTHMRPPSPTRTQASRVHHIAFHGGVGRSSARGRPTMHGSDRRTRGAVFAASQMQSRHRRHSGRRATT